MNLLDFFAMGGQERRRMLDDYVDDLNLERFLPPNLRPAGQFVAEANPVAAMGNAMQAGGVVFDPDATAEARKRAAVDMGVEMAMSLAPAALVRAGYLAAPAGLTEMFATPTGEVIGPMVRNAVSDVQYAGRSIAEGDLGGVLDVFRPSGQPQSVGAAGIGDNGGPPLNTVPHRASLFSPSLRAAENLKQNKGTYEQMRGMLLKGGAKDDELEWTGADSFFEGKKVTQDDLIDYLRKNTDAIKVQQNYSGEGRIGGSQLDTNPDAAFENWFQSYVADDIPWAGQITDDYVDGLVADLYYSDDDRVKLIHDMLKTPEDVQKFMDETGFTIDEINASEWLFDDGETKKLFAYGSDLVEELEGGRDELQSQALDYYKRSLRDEFDADPEDFAQRYDMSDVDEGIDVGETRYSKFMPMGGEKYQENLLRYADPQGKIAQEDIASSSHWRGDDEGTIYHTRQADYDIVDGGRARYIAEIQSDPQQNVNGRELLSYDDLATVGENKAILADLRQQDQDLDGQTNIVRFSMLNDFEDWMSQNPDAANRLKNEALIKEYNAKAKLDALFSDDAPATVPDNPAEWSDEQNQAYSDWYSNISRERNPNSLVALYAMRQSDLVRGDLNFLNKYREQIDDIARKKSDVRHEMFAVEAKIPSISAQYQAASGPFMKSQNRWLDNALRRSIVDAVNDPDVDYLTFPYNEQAIGVVGGNTYGAKQGAIDYYQRDTQNRLKKILKGIDPEVQIEDVDLRGTAQSELGDFNARGFRLTPEFRNRVRESGLPAWMIAGGLPLTGVFDYLREQKEKRNERLGGLMGYGG